jgi:hypothetical protein
MGQAGMLRIKGELGREGQGGGADFRCFGPKQKQAGIG